ncbi:hypothetical protein K8R14_01540 [bacterium]|nr:hypothetical protein [bacterium]
MKKIPVTFVLVGGGHTFQALALVDRLHQHVQPAYIGFKDEHISEHKIRIPGPYFKVLSSLREVRKKNLLSLFRKALPFFPAVVQSTRALRKTRSRALIACGGGPAAATIVAACLTGRSVIYVESLSRTQTHSLVGRLSYLFFADLFFVQWKEMLKLYPKAIWAGRLF